MVGVELAAAPGRAILQQLRASRAQHQDRRAARELDDMVEQVEQHRLGPLQVVDVQDHRPLGRERFEQPPDLQEQLLRTATPPLAETLEHRLGAVRRPASAPRSAART